MKHNARLLGLVAALLLLPAAARATMYSPTWSGEAQTTYQLYRFTNAANPSAATVITNAFGAPPAQITLGNFGEGWMDPNEQYSLPGEDGAWDLGQSGTITSAVPFASGSGLYQVDLFLDALAYQDIHQLPAWTVSGASVTGASYVVTDHQDPIFLGYWRHVIWTGTVEVTGSPTLTAVVTATDYGSCVDAMSIETRYTVIPEPVTLAGWAVFTAVLAIRRRLRSAGMRSVG